MKKIYYVSTLLFFTTAIFAQNNPDLSNSKNEFAIGVSGFYTKLLNRNFYGFAFDGKYYVQPKWAIGFNVALTSKNVAEDYKYYIEKPTVNFFEFSFLTHFDIHRSDRFRLGFTLSNGYGFANLTDRAYTETSDEGFETPITIARNSFYVLQVGTEAAFRVYKSKLKSGSEYFLRADLKNRKVFGSSNFGNSAGFNGLQFGIGILVVIND